MSQYPISQKALAEEGMEGLFNTLIAAMHSKALQVVRSHPGSALKWSYAAWQVHRQYVKLTMDGRVL